jgi:hypothetical protein
LVVGLKGGIAAAALYFGRSKERRRGPSQERSDAGQDAEKPRAERCRRLGFDELLTERPKRSIAREVLEHDPLYELESDIEEGAYETSCETDRRGVKQDSAEDSKLELGQTRLAKTKKARCPSLFASTSLVTHRSLVRFTATLAANPPARRR